MIAEHSWIIEGGRVAEFAGEIGYADVTFTTIERLTPLWIVLANGHRHYRTTLRAFGTPSGEKELMSADDDRVRDVHACRVLVRVFSKVFEIERRQRVAGAADVLRVLDEIEQAVREAKAAVHANDPPSPRDGVA